MILVAVLLKYCIISQLKADICQEREYEGTLSILKAPCYFEQGSKVNVLVCVRGSFKVKDEHFESA